MLNRFDCDKWGMKADKVNLAGFDAEFPIG